MESKGAATGAGNILLSPKAHGTKVMIKLIAQRSRELRANLADFQQEYPKATLIVEGIVGNLASAAASVATFGMSEVYRDLPTVAQAPLDAAIDEATAKGKKLTLEEMEPFIAAFERHYDIDRADAQEFASAVTTAIEMGLLLRGTTGAWQMRKVGRNVADKDVKKPYHPQDKRRELEAQYGKDLEWSTVPRESAVNVKLAGKRHPVTGVVFDQSGYPIFDDVAKFDTRLAPVVMSSSERKTHMRAATEQLKTLINSGEVRAGEFSQRQLEAIQKGSPKIPDYTWHHHQDRGRMQLIPEEIHSKTAHVGGVELNRKD